MKTFFKDSLDRVQSTPGTDFSAAVDHFSVCPRSRDGLRVALLSYRSNPHCGGQGIYVKYLSKALVELGHQVDVISGEPYPDLDARVRLIPLPGLNFYAYTKPTQALKDRGLHSLIDLKEWAGHVTGGFPEPATFGQRMLKYLHSAETSYDLVHDNQSLSYSLLALMRQNTPLVTTIHHPITRDLQTALSGEQNWGLRLFIRRWYSFLRMQKKVAPRLPQIITVSACSKKDLLQDFQLDPQRVEVIHNGVDLQEFSPVSAVKKVPGRIMTTTSADVPLKGLQYLLRAIHDLRPLIPDLHLTILGKPRPNGITSRQIRELGLGARVRFVKDLSARELCQEYASAQLAVVPSLYEGFGLPAAEAMACGLPVVATTGGGLPEVVGNAGLLVPPAHAEHLARAIKTLLASPGQARALGEQARKRMEQYFSWSRCAEKTVQVYKNTLIRIKSRL